MYVVIVGCGKIGYSLTKALSATEHEVLVIDRDHKKCEAIVEELGSVALVGDGCEIGVLREAGADRADVLIAVTGLDEDNLVACQMAKACFNVPKTVALINNTANEHLFTLLGIDVVVSSTQLILSHIEEELPAHPLVHVGPITGTDKELVEVKVPPDASAVGKCLKEITLPDGSLITLIVSRDGHAQIPAPESEIHANDEIFVVTTLEGEEALREAFTGVS